MKERPNVHVTTGKTSQMGTSKNRENHGKCQQPGDGNTGRRTFRIRRFRPKIKTWPVCTPRPSGLPYSTLTTNQIEKQNPSEVVMIDFSLVSILFGGYFGTSPPVAILFWSFRLLRCARWGWRDVGLTGYQGRWQRKIEGLNIIEQQNQHLWIVHQKKQPRTTAEIWEQQLYLHRHKWAKPSGHRSNVLGQIG